MTKVEILEEALKLNVQRNQYVIDFKNALGTPQSVEQLMELRRINEGMTKITKRMAELAKAAIKLRQDIDNFDILN